MSRYGLDRRMGTNGLSIFAPTADQRYLLGADVFLRTHFPMVLRRYQNGRPAGSVSEDELLTQVLDTAGRTPGNRLWILYGAAGSGKSELMKWLETRIGQVNPVRASVTVRIARTELDVLSITERFRSLLSDGFFDETTHRRWQAARQKPRTLTKLILLSALESLLDSDEAINALFYRLLNAVQPYIERILASGELQEAPFESIELMSLETWQAIINETAIEAPLEYEQFRHQMITVFRDHLLEGVALPPTLRHISLEVRAQRGLHPILLVDDLVQSLNLFATDLLDYFITLEAGDWDVVLGLTPAAFEASQRGRNLLGRIAYLDTIDDRVEKLWLSDEAGHDSYVLTEENCHHFAARYLTEYHHLNGLTDKPALYPFQREVLVRIYRALPSGKGKARYFLRHVRNILEQVVEGEPLLEAVAKYARTESVARCQDPTLAAICELYGPLVPDESTRKVTLPASLLHFFGLPAKDSVVPVEPLLKLTLQREAITQVVDDEEKAAIHDWLLGRPVNRQLLQGVRRGAARWLRAICPPDQLHRNHIARPHGVLRWHKTYLGTRPPICLEGVDDETEGIPLSRVIGLVAFDLHRYATSIGNEAKLLALQLAAEPTLMSLCFAAMDYRKRALARLTDQLGISVDEMTVFLYLWSMIVEHKSHEHPPGFGDDFWAQLTHDYIQSPIQEAQLDEGLHQAIRHLFDDFFKLRENIYDGLRIVDLLRGRTPKNLLDSLMCADVTRLDRDYRLDGMPLRDALLTIQEIVHLWRRVKNTESALSQVAQRVLDALMTGDGPGVLLVQVPVEVWAELQGARPDVYAKLCVVLRSLPEEVTDNSKRSK
jgi:hypothetical protein